jgi:4-hydroxybenzoate polyprenyltransferase
MSEAVSGSHARAWLELARISNAPTVVSNVIAGLTIGSQAAAVPIDYRDGSLIAAGAVLLYTAGMILNDVLDVAVDRTERPGRPIPSGRVSRHAAFSAAVLMLALGATLVALAGARPLAGAVALVGSIVLYDLVHRRTAASVLLMGLCRGLLYITPISLALALGDRPLIAMPAALLAAYTASFSLLARGEASAHAGARSALAWVPVPLGVGVVLAAVPSSEPHWAWAALPAAALVLAATRASRPTPDIRRAVLTWIAGFSLIDAAVCAALGRSDLAGACLACWFLTAWSHRRILGT